MGKDIGTILFLLLIVASSYVNGIPMGIPLLIFVCFFTASFLRDTYEQNRIDFINQLKSCRKELRNGGTIVINNTLLRYDSVLTTYDLTVGGITSSTTIISPFYHCRGHDHVESLVYSFTSLLFGWWSLPTGPFTTIATIRRNMSGGQKITVAMLIDHKLIERIQFLNATREEIPQPTKKKTTSEEPKQQIDTGPGSPSAKALIPSQTHKWLQTLGKKIEEHHLHNKHKSLKQARLQTQLHGIIATKQTPKKNRELPPY